MIVSSSPPLQRVHEILLRMQSDTENVECLKTCCGALAILAKDEANKLLIARDGTRLVLTIMEAHSTRPDLQEAVCDLLWSLAFNNGLVKEVVGRQGGIALILKGMSSHLSSPELVKSACGALSNMCQNTYNQNIIAAHGGVRTILSAMHSHRMNSSLLPFVFDALASLIVGNQRNGLLVTDGGGIRSVLTTMSLHGTKREVVKSGCHALAILSDIQGQGARIAGADGVKVLLPALRAHVRYLHLHRIAAIVLLRMLQEAAVARDIAWHGGVVIMLGMLREHAREEETVAATVHILYLITHADVLRGGVEVEVGRHFSGIPPPCAAPERNVIRGISVVSTSTRGTGTGAQGGNTEYSTIADRDIFNAGSVRALVLVLQEHMERKDIVRAATRSLANLIRVRSVVSALIAEESSLPTVLQCLAMHTTSRGITDSAVSVAGALLAAAHDGCGMMKGSFTNGKVRNDADSNSPVSKRSTLPGGSTNFKLSVLGANGRAHQRSPPRLQQNLPQASRSEVHARNCFGLRFAYAAGVDDRISVTCNSELQVHGCKTKAGRFLGAVSDGGGGGAGALAGAKEGTPPSPAAAASKHATSTADGDPGAWNTSMQALCAMLRARRRDAGLAGLIFLALEACIEEWAHSLDATRSERQQHQHQQNPSSPGALPATDFGDGWHAFKGCVPQGERGQGAARPPLQRASPSHLPTSPSSVVPAPARLEQWQKSTTETTAADPAREKMHLGIRESIKAGLVWAEAVPLGTGRGAGEDAVGRRESGVEAGAEKAASARTATTCASFSAVTAGAVTRLCRLLKKGLTEMGFGRRGALIPLGEAASLLAFNANVPEVLEKMKSARQPSASLESIEYLMREFLPVDPPEVPAVEAQDPVALDSCPASTLGCSAVDNCSGTRDSVSDKKSKSLVASARGVNPVPSRRSDGDNVAAGGGGDHVGSAGEMGRNGISSGANGGDRCWDETVADGASLIMASPPDLEPILPPSPAMSGDPDTRGHPVEPHCATGVASASNMTSAATTSALGGYRLPSRYPNGAGCGGTVGGDDRLWLVYDGVSAAGKGVTSRVNAADPYWVGRAAPGSVCPHSHSMEFNSSFESANLLRAVQRGPAEYDLFLRPDLHTHGHTQWFYFAVRGTHPPGVEGSSVVKFNVVNLTKPDSLFAMGMRPVLYSHQDASAKGLGWTRCGHGIDYRNNGYSWYKPDGSQGSFYTLTLYVTFPNPGDTYRLAHAHPYSYSDHKRHLGQLLADERTSRYLAQSVLCRTLGGNECDLLTITDAEDTPIAAIGGDGSGGIGEDSGGHRQQQEQRQAEAFASASRGLHQAAEEPATARDREAGAWAPAVGAPRDEIASTNTGDVGDSGRSSSSVAWAGRNGVGGGARRGRSKRCVFISARVHPGETPASWMMRGILDFITGETAEARLLRSLFVFKIVPMLNPDGVAFGNNRCSLAGVDLNRQWKRPSRTQHPTVFWLKQFIRQEQGARGVTMYIDLHGHSRKMNIFMYGADEKRRGVSCPAARVFPKLLSWNRLGRKYVSFKDCSFAVKKGRESTARVVVARDLGIGNSYTVESTFCGVDFGPLKDHHLNTDHLQEAGVAICDALLDYYLPNAAHREHVLRALLVRDNVQVAASRFGLQEGPHTPLTVSVASACSASSGASGHDDVNIDDGHAGVQDGQRRDEDDDVVDDNDDLESEDDNDSTAPNPSADEGEEDADVDFARSSPRCAHAEAFSDLEPRSMSRAEIKDAVATSSPDATAAASASRDNNGDGELDGGVGANGHCAGGEDLWPGTGFGGVVESSGAAVVRRWGRVVEEADGDDFAGSGGDDFDRTGVDMRPPSDGAFSAGASDADRDGAGLAAGLNAKEDVPCGRPPRAKDSISKTSWDQRVNATSGMGSGTSGGDKGPSSSAGRKDKRRSSGSRGPRASVLNAGHLSKSSVSLRQHRIRAYGGGGDGAARRASDVALQAASNVLAACKSSSQSGRSKRRVRSVNSGEITGDRFVPGDGCGASRGGGVANGASSRAGGSNGGRGRRRGACTGGYSPRTRTLAICPAVSDLDSAPRSGSSLMHAPEAEADGLVAGTAVVKRGGNLRWLSSTEFDAAGEASCSRTGSLRPHAARHASPRLTQSPLAGVDQLDASPVPTALGDPNTVSARGGASRVMCSTRGMKGGADIAGERECLGMNHKALGGADSYRSGLPKATLPVLDDPSGGSLSTGGGSANGVKNLAGKRMVSCALRASILPARDKLGLSAT